MSSVSLEADQAALSFDGNVLVEAGPGTGKTHLIAEKAVRLVEAGVDPKRILVLTFSTRAAAELRERFVSRGVGACEIRTFHGFASKLLEAGGPRFRTRRLLGAFAESQLFAAAVRGSELHTFNAITKSSERFVIDAAKFASDLQRSERSSLGMLRETATPRICDLLAIADRANGLRERLKASDLNDLIARCVVALEDPSSPQRTWLANRYEYLLVDEFQDFDRLQLALCDRIGAKAFAVGDPAQSIYRFRGAVSGIFAEGAQRLSLKRFVLEESRRCPQSICDLAARTPLIGASPLRSLSIAKGEIAVRSARTTLDEAALIADRVEEELAAGTKPEKIAVLVRTMQPLARVVVAELQARRIAVVATGSDAFFNDPDITLLRFALRALAHPNRDEFWAAFLSSPLLGFEATELRLRLARQSFTKVEEAIEWLEACGLRASIAPAAIGSLVRNAARHFEQDDIGAATRCLVRGLRLIERHTLSTDVVGARMSIARIARFIDALSETQATLSGVGERASSTMIVDLVDDNVEELGSDETPPDGAQGVRVMSIHGAKGLQFGFVIVGDAVDGKFPASSRASSLFSIEDRSVLEAAAIVAVDARADDGLIEEASLWYVAVTRTRDRLLFTYATHGADGTPQRVSRFLPPDLHPGEDEVPFERTRQRIERTLMQSTEPEARDGLRRLAAESPIVAAMLNGGESAFDGIDARPVVLDRAFSVSAAELWLHCPRHFYYKHALRLTVDQNNAMKSGNAIHRTLQRFHEEFRSFGPGSSVEINAWKQRLHELRMEESDRDTTGALEVRRARGVVLDRLLERYAARLARDADAETFTVEAVEADIVTTLPGGALQGRLDRVDVLASGELVLRDYKAGSKRGKLGKEMADRFGAEATPLAGGFDPDFKPQLALYRIGAEQKFGRRVVRIEYMFLKGDKKSDDVLSDALVIDEASLPQIQRLEEFVGENFVHGFARGVNSPIPTTSDGANCHFCDFRRKRLCAGIEA